MAASPPARCWAVARRRAPWKTASARRPVSHRPWLAGGAFSAIAASVVVLLATPQFTTVPLQDQLVASHGRRLLANHLSDVATSNLHIVKPWFNGNIDFAPPVPELADKGFPLVGGRLDYLNGRVVPAIVYHRRFHSIIVFVIPNGPLSSPSSITTHREGYSIVRWTSGDLEFWAVSNIETADLELFHHTLVHATS